MDVDLLALGLGAVAGAAVGYLELLGLRRSVKAIEDGRMGAAAISSALRMVLVAAAMLGLVQLLQLAGLLGGLLGFTAVRAFATQRMAKDV